MDGFLWSMQKSIKTIWPFHETFWNTSSSSLCMKSIIYNFHAYVTTHLVKSFHNILTSLLYSLIPQKHHVSNFTSLITLPASTSSLLFERFIQHFLLKLFVYNSEDLLHLHRNICIEISRFSLYRAEISPSHLWRLQRHAFQYFWFSGGAPPQTNAHQINSQTCYEFCHKSADLYFLLDDGTRSVLFLSTYACLFKTWFADRIRPVAH